MWRWFARIAATLLIPIVGMLFWPWRSADGATPHGQKITHVVLGHSVVPNEGSVLRSRDETALPIGNRHAGFLAQVQRTGLCAWHQEFCKYRGLYRQVGFPFIVLSLIVLPCWLVLRLHRLRTSGHPLSPRREILLFTLVVYLLCLATLTLTPNRSSRLSTAGTGRIELLPNLTSLTCSSAILPAGSGAGMFCKQNAVGNVMLFFPLGVLIPLVWSHLRFWRGIQIAIVLSFIIELVQYLASAWGSYRSADVNDVILNVFGASLGLALMFLMRLRPGTRPAVLRG